MSADPGAQTSAGSAPSADVVRARGSPGGKAIERISTNGSRKISEVGEVREEEKPAEARRGQERPGLDHLRSVLDVTRVT